MKRGISKTTSAPPSSGWKKPDEVIKLQRIKQKQRALQQRFNGPQQSSTSKTIETNQKDAPGKRKNPFGKNSEPAKRQKSLDMEDNLTTDDSIFELLVATKHEEVKNIEATNSATSVLSYEQRVEEAEDVDVEAERRTPMPYLPIDWTLKSRLRFLCRTQVPGNNLKTNQEASGLTSFVRCIDPSNTTAGLDISPGSQFSKGTFYWQYPHLPWLQMYPRNAKQNHGFNIGEKEAQALQRDWTEAFRSLFQLTRSRQCPYFYVCANSFTVLFRAAGIGGRAETHAFLTPTSRGIRQAMKSEDIEFTLPLKKSNDANNRSIDSTKSPNTSNSLDDTVTNNTTLGTNANDSQSSSEEDEEKWLESLGVEAEQIKRINEKHFRKIQNNECEDDFSESSIALVEGVDCQAFFNFLLNSKSSVAKVGRLANIPPTLLAPVAFQGASLQQLSLRSSKVRLDGEDYSSMEVKGVILPHCLPYLANLLAEIKDCFSATVTSHPGTAGFNKASTRLIEDMDKENAKASQSDMVFGRENLSDCGLATHIVEAMCRTTPQAIQSLDKMWFVKEQGGYLY
ncbi:protein downstream neighbor of son homolog [Culicoides brevitarsis]|uniref:protein downstream neighbor of son homolog n=1 Tax=Culicoides brevitarsis TaxID=469753 RepID=UPI00307B1957